MPKSKNRAAHKLHQQHHNHTHGSTFNKEPERTSTARTFTIPVCLVFGGGMAWFAAGESPVWIIAGLLAGGVIGYFLGNKMDRAFGKR